MIVKAEKGRHTWLVGWCLGFGRITRNSCVQSNKDERDDVEERKREQA